TEITMFSFPTTIAWVMSLHCQIRVHRIKAQCPSPRDFSRATKSIRTWVASWMIAVVVICGAGVYFSMRPEDFSGANSWIVCSAVSVAVYSSVAKVLGEAESEEYEVQQCQGTPAEPAGIIASIFMLCSLTSFIKNVATCIVVLAALSGIYPG
ncbi:MAG: hypothetical protein ACRC0L_04035, partial [Angustibacter sp.]